MMNAARIHRFGSPDVIDIERIDVPAPAAGEVLVRVAAAGVGPWDAWVRSGKSQLPQPLPLILGSDIAGVVEDVGAGVTGLSRGEAIFGVSNARFTNGYAEYTAAAANMIARKPRTLSDVEAASVPVVAVTAWQMLFDQAQIHEGQTVFVHGGAGNVGAYVVQLARRKGARVMASVIGPNADYVRALGADDVIDLRATPQKEIARWADAVVDTVGGPSTESLFEIAKRGGILVSTVAQPDLQRAKEFGIRALSFIVNVDSRHLAELCDLFEAGQLIASIGTVLPLPEARLAHEMLDGVRPHGRGKIVLDVGAR